MATEHAANSSQYCTFFVDDLFFGIEVERIQEVIRYQDITPVPLASRVVRGLINLRGQIVTAVDLRRRLKIGDRDDKNLPMNVVVNTEGEVVSLLVDEIGDVIEVSQGEYEPAPDTISPNARELIRGVYKLDGQLMLVLDTDRAMALDKTKH